MSSLPAALLLLALGAWADPPSKELAEPAKPADKELLEEQKRKTLSDGELKEELKKKKYSKDKEQAKKSILEKQKPGKLPPAPLPPEGPPPGGGEEAEPPEEEPRGTTYAPRRRVDDDGTDAPPPPPEEVERVSRQVSREGGRAVGRALKSADALKRSLTQGQDLATDAPGLGAMNALAPRGAPDPANPVTPHDLVLASMSGFGGAFTALGLKAGSSPTGEPAVLRSDGSPASEEQVAALRARIGAEPKALMRQPAFFEVLPRERFEDLKRDYRERPSLHEGAFRDISLTERDRDFLWSASCSRLSGDCNPHASAQSYRKGDDVPAKDLDEIWEEVAATEPEAEEDGVSEYTDEDLEQMALAEAAQERLSQSVFGGARLARLLEQAGAAFAGLTGLFAGAEAEGAGTGASSAAGSAAGLRAAGAGTRAAVAAGRAGGAGPALEPPAPSRDAAPRAGRAAVLTGAAAAFALALLALAKRRR